MRGIGSKCMKKAVESVFMAVFITVAMYYSGMFDQFLKYFNPGLAKRMNVEKALKGTHDMYFSEDSAVSEDLMIEATNTEL